MNKKIIALLIIIPIVLIVGYEIYLDITMANSGSPEDNNIAYKIVGALLMSIICAIPYMIINLLCYYAIHKNKKIILLLTLIPFILIVSCSIYDATQICDGVEYILQDQIFMDLLLTPFWAIPIIIVNLLIYHAINKNKKIIALLIIIPIVILAGYVIYGILTSNSRQDFLIEDSIFGLFLSPTYASPFIIVNLLAYYIINKNKKAIIILLLTLIPIIISTSFVIIYYAVTSEHNYYGITFRDIIQNYLVMSITLAIPFIALSLFIYYVINKHKERVAIKQDNQPTSDDDGLSLPPC